MTKLEILQDIYNPARKRDTWWVTGKNIITTDTRYYNENLIYQVGWGSEALEGALVFCAKEYIGALNWNNAEITAYREISFGNDIVSSRFYLLLTREELDLINEPFDEEGEVNVFYIPPDETFIPFQEQYERTDIVQISDDDYDEIISTAIGGVFIQDDEFEYTREEISRLALRPALREFFKWCPATRSQELSCTSNVQNVPMPKDAYCVVGLSLQQHGPSGSSIENPLLWSLLASPYLGVNIGSLTGQYFGTAAPRTTTNNGNTLLLSRAAQQGYVNYQRRMHYEGPYKDIDGSITGTPGDRYITIYCNILGSFNIWWGIKSMNFEDVEYSQKENAIKLCAAKVKQLFGAIRRQSKTSIPGQVDYSYLVTEGKEEEKAVVDELKSLVKASGVIRGSL